jgi:gamma-glutamyl-gamma-aminobutyrate hydrolase PuuD
MLAICRGMQMLSVVSGADMIQDISQWISKDGIE